MKKDIENLIAYLKKNYKKLPKSNVDGNEYVIFAKGDFAGEYGYGSADLESWGIDKDGNLHWVYASGCSCDTSCGNDQKTIKDFIANPETEATDILKAIHDFKKNKKEFLEGIQSYNY